MGDCVYSGSRGTEAQDHIPGIVFHIILWDNAYDQKRKQKLHEQLYTGLSRKGFQIHLVSQILSDYPQTRADYELSPQDNHPNARACRAMAAYITRHILEAPHAIINRSDINHGRNPKHD